VTPSSAFGFLLIVAGLTAALLVVRWAQGLIPSIALRRFVHRGVLPLLELAVAAILLLGVLTWLAADASPERLLPAGAMVIALGWAGRRVLDDFVNGVVLRIEGAVEPGRFLSVEGVEGTIRRVGHRAIEVETDVGTLVRIPFSRIARESVATVATAVGQHAHTFVLEVPRDRSPARLIRDVTAAAMMSPWSSITRQPQVDLQGESTASYTLEITTWVLDPAWASDVEATLRRMLSAAGPESTR